MLNLTIQQQYLKKEKMQVRYYDGSGCYNLDEYEKAAADAQIQEDRIIY